jgi:H+/Cl- antiporter ClcA
MNAETGKYIIAGGILVVIAGIVVYFFHDRLHWVGRLPGDVRIEKENFHFYFPLTTMILFSIVLSLLLWLLRKL